MVHSQLQRTLVSKLDSNFSVAWDRVASWHPKLPGRDPIRRMPHKDPTLDRNMTARAPSPIDRACQPKITFSLVLLVKVERDSWQQQQHSHCVSFCLKSHARLMSCDWVIFVMSRMLVLPLTLVKMVSALYIELSFIKKRTGHSGGHKTKRNWEAVRHIAILPKLKVILPQNWPPVIIDPTQF